MILRKAVAVGIGRATAAEIDAVNILEATRLAMRRALNDCRVHPDFLLVDAVSIPGPRFPQRAIIMGDQLSVSIAAASVIAKVLRDEEMARVHEHYPQYDFSTHKGYGTPEHLRLLEKYGPSPIHRRSFDPVAKILQRECPLETPARSGAPKASPQGRQSKVSMR